MSHEDMAKVYFVKLMRASGEREQAERKAAQLEGRITHAVAYIEAYLGPHPALSQAEAHLARVRDILKETP